MALTISEVKARVTAVPATPRALEVDPQVAVPDAAGMQCDAAPPHVDEMMRQGAETVQQLHGQRSTLKGAQRKMMVRYAT